MLSRTPGRLPTPTSWQIIMDRNRAQVIVMVVDLAVAKTLDTMLLMTTMTSSRSGTVLMKHPKKMEVGIPLVAGQRPPPVTIHVIIT